MDYRRALSIKVNWEKETKPTIKCQIENIKRVREDNKKSCMRVIVLQATLMTISEVKATSESLREATLTNLREKMQKYKFEDVEKLFEDNAFLKKRIEELTVCLETFRSSVKYQKYKICAMSHIYNGDYESAVKFYHKLKAELHKYIEIAEESSRYMNTVNVHVSRGEVRPKTHTEHIKEDAYLKSCNVAKENIERVETLLATLALIKGDVKQVLQASKRMNKRRNRKD